MPSLRTASAAVLMLALAACAEPQTVESVTSAAREVFGQQIAPYQDHPSAEMIAGLGPPDHETATPEGGRKLVLERHDSKTVKDAEAIPVTCTVTALTNDRDVVFFVFAGGNTVYCSEAFANKPA